MSECSLFPRSSDFLFNKRTHFPGMASAAAAMHRWTLNGSFRCCTKSASVFGSNEFCRVLAEAGSAVIVAEIAQRRQGPIHKEGRWISWGFCARAFTGQFSATLLILTWCGMEASPVACIVEALDCDAMVCRLE